jgi:peptidyl-prolyl cis-trans isomerase A (cyclophilin A)
MSLWQRRVCLVLAIVIVAVARPTAAGQATVPPAGRGDLFGVVTDSRGGVLPGVTVTVAGPSLSAAIKAVTDTAGAYLFPQIPSGTYNVAFSRQGYFPLTRESVVVAPGERLGLNVQLALGPNAREAPPLTAAPASKPGEVLVTLETSLGKIVIALDTVHAPITSQNCLKYVDGGFYDGGQFHRATRSDNYTPAPPNRPPMEIIQAGVDPAKKSQQFPAIPLERTSVTGLKHVVGVVSMARGTAADTAQSDFFILLDDQPSLDFGGLRFDDGQGAAAFGRVIEGMDVVRKIQQQPTQGQNLAPPIPIVKASRAGSFPD